MTKRPASADWLGTTEQALRLLRVEYSFLTAAPAARLCGRPICRHISHVRALRSIPGSYARKLGVLCSAAPAEKRAAIKEAFSAILPAADAATMRGVADGTEYAFEVTVRGANQLVPRDEVILDSSDGSGRRVLAYCRRVPADRQGAEDLREQIEREAWDAGAEHVDVRVRAA
jgi:hypothetical protein